MTTIFAILCIAALLTMAICIPHSTEVPSVSLPLSPSFIVAADALEVTEVATRASDCTRIHAAANRFGSRVPTHTLRTALRIASLAHDIACEPRAALLAASGTPDTAAEVQRLQRYASAARDDLPGALARFAALQSSPILDEIVTEIAERR